MGSSQTWMKVTLVFHKRSSSPSHAENQAVTIVNPGTSRPCKICRNLSFVGSSNSARAARFEQRRLRFCMCSNQRSPSVIEPRRAWVLTWLEQRHSYQRAYATPFPRHLSRSSDLDALHP